jgi:hypothetical protein
VPRLVLGEIALCCLCLVVTPSHAGSCGGWSTLPPALTYDSLPLTEGARPTYKTLSGLVMVMVDGVCHRKRSFLGHRYLLEDLSSSVPAYGILHIVNDFVPCCAYPLAAQLCYLGMFPRHSNVRR